MAVANRAISQQEAAEINGENTAAVHRRCQGENQNTAAKRQQRVQPGRQGDAVNHLLQQIAAGKADDNPEAKLLENMPGKHPAQAGFVLLDHLNQGDGQEHRHRVVAAGFNLQRRADTLVQPFAAEEGEHRRRIGRADNRADQ
ncbi:hypothetical protein D3C81_1471080 [compost metagenome]